MSDFRRIAAAGRSLRTVLMTAFEEEPPLEVPTNVVLIRTDDLQRREGQSLILEPAVSLLLHRCELNQTVSDPDPHQRPSAGRAPEPLTLHFLATAWGTDPEHEHRILGRTLQVLYDNPVLNGPRLDPSANWSSDDKIRVLLDDITSADLTRIFHPYGCALRLSIAVLARLGG
jgi:hypothetical protein